ncbi:MAG: glucose-6-phosphate dehydrogenase [Sulfobacillus benefaciens]|uniref:Glucose-6-phosphate 1-dehydrogenase n=1 Tax=Sulfobacillus benefaciens TaxID=453960 RepID=A0A2T2XI25_9FIRM|nr:MAG: glucose-6-phosphate dehydrogenase [Sulfobacillus benefaciens]
MTLDSQEVSTIVIIGATGDLTRRLLFPAIYRLYALKQWPNTRIIGYAVEDFTQAQFLQHLEQNLQQFEHDYDEAVWNSLKNQVEYMSGDLTAASLSQLKGKITDNALFYLALPPQLFGDAAEGLGEAGLSSTTGGWRRLVVEKPFGWDFASAKALRERIHKYWPENQVYRIDHFLGKETTQNLLVFRFANRFLEPVWNSDHVRQVQITVAETLGVEGRWQYYDQAGALRDMIQNHLMQLFTLTALDPLSTWDADVLREHKVEVLRAVRPIPADQVEAFASRGQYQAGVVGSQPVKGYHEETGIPASSITDTFAALKLYVDNWRWHGTPFYLRSGKRLAARFSEIALELRDVPPGLFGKPLSNWLIFRMWPDQCIDVVAWAKEPGLALETRQIILATPYQKIDEPDYSAYEQLLLEALHGDRAYFLRFDEVEESWRILTPVLDAWRTGAPEPYDAGSQGPKGQDRLMIAGHHWRTIGVPE